MGKTSLIKVDIHCYIDDFKELEKELLKNPLIEKGWPRTPFDTNTQNTNNAPDTKRKTFFFTTGFVKSKKNQNMFWISNYLVPLLIHINIIVFITLIQIVAFLT